MSRLFVEFRRIFAFIVENMATRFPFNPLFVELKRTFPFVVEAIKQLPMISFVVEFHRTFPLIVEHLAAGFPFNPLFVELTRTFPMCVEIIRTLRCLQKELRRQHRLCRKRCIPHCTCMCLFLQAGSKIHQNNYRQ